MAGAHINKTNVYLLSAVLLLAFSLFGDRNDLVLPLAASAALPSPVPPAIPSANTLPRHAISERSRFGPMFDNVSIYLASARCCFWRVSADSQFGASPFERLRPTFAADFAATERATANPQSRAHKLSAGTVLRVRSVINVAAII